MARGKAPTTATFVISLVLYIVAILDYFSVLNLGSNLGDWAWILGHGLLLIGVQVRGL